MLTAGAGGVDHSGVGTREHRLNRPGAAPPSACHDLRVFTDRSPQRPLPAVPPGAPGRHYAAGSPNATRSGVRDVLRACLLPGRWTWLLLATSLGLAVLSVGF